MTYKRLQIFTIILPTLIIGGFEYIRHYFLLPYLSMEMGNHYITLLTFLISYIYASWMFRTIQEMNERLSKEQARRAVYEERNRLARELHDGIAQTLFFLNIKLKQGKIAEAQTAVSEINNHVRQAIFNLRYTPEEGCSLTERLGKWLQEWSTLTGIEVVQEIDLPNKYFSPGEDVQLFGVIQEAFTNIRKHSKASQASIRLLTNNRGWQLIITDNGCGIQNPDLIISKYGMTMMHERALQLGAAFSISQQKTGGTKLFLRVEKGGKSNDTISYSSCG